jgi:translocation and assembly module TamB
MALLSTAAGALGGKGGGGIQSKLANSLGLDELGVQPSGTAAGAATGLQNTVVTVGKRISSRAYLSFEQGAGTATSLVKLATSSTRASPAVSDRHQQRAGRAVHLGFD